MAEEIGANAPGRLNYRQRKVSFSDALSKLTPKPFTRRRTAPDFFNTSSSSSSYTKIEPQKRPQQRQPQSQQDPSTSYRVSRSASLFNGLNSLVPRLTIPRNHKESDLTAPKSVRPPRKINHRFSQPASFLNFKAPEQEATEPLIPKKKPGTQIIHRALMQPISNPPLPRRSTMGNLTRNPSTQIPSYMRPTSSSAARRNSGPAVLKNRAPTTTATPNKPRSRPSGRNPPAMNFSLPSSSRVQEATIQESPAPITSPKVPTTSPKIISEQSGQSERLKLTVNSTYSFEELLRTLTPEDEIAEFEAERAKSKPAVIEGPSDDSPPTEEPSDDPPPTKEPSDNPTPTEEPGDEPPADEETGDASESIYVANPFQITTAQPSGYWAGRMSVLSDRFRSEALEYPDSSMDDDGHRLHRVFAHLRGQCATQEAIASLEAFERKWAMRGQGRDDGVSAPHAVHGGSGGKKVKEKKGVFEKLTGRKK